MWNSCFGLFIFSEIRGHENVPSAELMPCSAPSLVAASGVANRFGAACGEIVEMVDYFEYAIGYTMRPFPVYYDITDGIGNVSERHRKEMYHTRVACITAMHCCRVFLLIQG